MRATRSRTVRRATWTTTAGLALAALVTTGSVTPATAAPDEVAEQPIGTIRVVSHGLEDKTADDDSRNASVSDDGRYVAFHSQALDLVAQPKCREDEICTYVHDRQTRETVMASVTPSGGAPNDSAAYPSISGDGRYVAYQSQANNLVADDRGRHTDVFVYDRQTGVTELISRNPEGEPANRASGEPVLSSDGRFVLYNSAASDLVPGDRKWGSDIYRTDRVTGETIVVSLTPRGKRPHGDSTPDAMSADGRIAVYRSIADDIAPRDDNDTWDLFAYDTETGETEVVSRAVDGGTSDGNAGGASISDDGRFITFGSDGSDIVPPDLGGHSDVFLLDRVAGEITRVSVGADGAPANGPSVKPTTSADGTEIAFGSLATDLGAGGVDDVSDVFVIDLVAGTIEIVTRGRGGSPPDNYSTYPFLSGDGSVVAWESEATNLVRGDRNGSNDVFAYRRR